MNHGVCMSGDPVVLASVMLPARYGGFCGFLLDRLTVAYLEIQMEVELAVLLIYLCIVAMSLARGGEF